MVKTPFHRQILPFVFVVIFIIMAPALVFYTAGYRWNAKKGVIEVNGTLILDSAPRGAEVILNGKTLDVKTPTTIQRVSPGSYSLEFKMEGYNSWSKQLKVEAERVTFANDIILWPKTEASLLMEGSFTKLLANPDSPYLLALKSSGTSTELTQLDMQNKSIISSKPAIGLAWDNLHWSADNRSVVAENFSDGSSWLVRLKPLAISTLPNGYYHWESGSLEGASGQSLIRISSTGVVQNEALPDGIIDVSLDASIKRQPDGTLALFMGGTGNDGLILPEGAWSIAAVSKNDILLQDSKNWLLIDLDKKDNPANRAYGDLLIPLTIKRQTRYLLKNGHELYIWTKGRDPELIDRQSQPFIAAAWHTEGRDIMAVSGNDVYIINLDPRNGYAKTLLGSFDSINDALIYGDKVIISGQKNNRNGIFTLPLSIDEASLLSMPKF